ncbi:MAG: LPS export ABC transporter periplasmic protein LptC [Gemmatimonadota bacterium]
MTRGAGSWAVAWLLAASWAACSPQESGPLAEAALLRLQCDQVMTELEHFLSADGVRRATVVADTACFLENQSTVHLKNVEVTFYDAAGGPSSTLTSDSATYEWLSGDMRAFGDVVVVDAETGRRLETPVMHYVRASEEIWSDRPSTMTEPDGTVVQGTGFRSNSGMDRVEMENARLTKPPRPQTGRDTARTRGS